MLQPVLETTAPDEPKIRRTRAGCVRCKLRRIKCPENKPACARCIRAGCRCTYAVRGKDLERAPRAILPAAQTAAPLTIPATQAAVPLGRNPSLVEISPLEASYVDHFKNHVVHQLGTQRPVNFWLETVMREFMRDNSIRQCVISIGALDMAVSNSPSIVPLFKLRPSEHLSSGQHQSNALEYYSKALSGFRSRLSSKDLPPRSILITAMLFLVFELLQGNTHAVDRIAASVSTILKDFLFYNASNKLNSLIAAASDDDGVLAGELLFGRLIAFNSLFSPMYPLAGNSATLWRFSVEDASVPDPQEGSLQFWSKFWKSVTISAVAHYRISRRVLEGEPTHAGSELHREQGVLLEYLLRWSQALQEQLVIESDPDVPIHLDLAKVGTDVAEVAIRCSLDATGAAWDSHRELCLKVLKLNQKLVSYDPHGPTSRSILLDGVLPSCLLAARECRDLEVRTLALKICASVVTPSSSWDVKGVYLGTYALLNVEDAHRDAKGHIPWDARYLWTEGHWSDSFREFHVTLTSRVRTDGLLRKKKLILLPKEFNIA